MHQIEGIGKPREDISAFKTPRPTYDGSESDVQWVELSGSQYSVEDVDLGRWLHIHVMELSLDRTTSVPKSVLR